MKFKTLTTLVIFVFCIYDFAYSHSGRTNSAGCHRVTATGGYHCHNSSGSSGGGSSSRSEGSRYGRNDQVTQLVFIGAIVIIIIGVAVSMPNRDKDLKGCGCLLSQTLYNPIPTDDLFNQVSQRSSIHNFKYPTLNLGRHGFSGWQLRATYTFHF